MIEYWEGGEQSLNFITYQIIFWQKSICKKNHLPMIYANIMVRVIDLFYLVDGKKANFSIKVPSC